MRGDTNGTRTHPAYADGPEDRGRNQSLDPGSEVTEYYVRQLIKRRHGDGGLGREQSAGQSGRCIGPAEAGDEPGGTGT